MQQSEAREVTVLLVKFVQTLATFKKSYTFVTVLVETHSKAIQPLLNG